MALKQIGVQAVVKDSDKYESILNRINQVTSAATDRLKSSMGKVPDATAMMGKGFDSLVDKIKEFVSQALSGIPVIGDFADEIVALANPTMIAVAAIGALTVAIVGLGVQGGKIKGVQQSFETLTGSIKTLDNLLPNLRESVKGTVTDFELMRVTNVALAGASKDFATQFGEALPKVLELARVQAQATGQDVDYLVNSLITGIKRASPMLIDNTGIVLKVGQANEMLAKKLGKSVEALTAEEKQVAVLNAVLEAGAGITAQYANAQEFASAKIARAQTTITNLMNSVQVAFEPLASAILDIVNLLLNNISKIVAGFMTIVQPIINVISSIINAITSILAPIVNFIGDTIGTVFTTIGYIVETVAAPFQILIEVFGKVAGAVVEFLLKPFGWLIDLLSKVITWIVDRARDFLRAGAVLIGAFAAGMLRAANTLVLPTVIAIATLIADFLVGQSPPPKGPLSHIDDGGAATMEAWLAGFVGVGLDPIEKVVGEVNAAMGSIANFSISQVETRLKELDKALQPFADRLAIVKANFEALQPVTDAAFSIIDRQMDKAVQALAMGAEGSAEQVRQLDAQRQALQEYIDAQQESIDQAQIQYALAQAAQARERVLLEIRKKQLEVDKIVDPVEREKKQKELDKEKEKAGSGSTPPELGGSGFGLPTPDKGGGFVGELKDLFEGGFELGGGTEELKKFQQGGKLLQDQFDRIGKGLSESPLINNIKTAMDNIAKLFDPTNSEGWIFKVLQWLAEQSDTGNPKGIVGWFVNLPNTLRNAVSDLSGIIKTQVVDPISKAFVDALDPSNKESLAGKFNHFFTEDGDGTLQGILKAPLTWFNDNVLVPILQMFTDFINAVVDPQNVESLAGRMLEFFTGSGEGTLQYFLTAPIRWFVDTVLTPLIQQFDDLWNALLGENNAESFASKIANFFTGEGEGTLKAILSSIATWVKATIANPFIGAFNSVIEAIENFINNTIIKAMHDIANILYSLLDAVGQGGSDIGQKLRAFQNSSVSFGTIPYLEKGGLYGKGMFASGEKGVEVGMAAQPFAMFSNRFVKAIDLFANVMAKPMPFPVLTGGGTTNYNNSNDSQVNNFYGVKGTEDAARRVAMMRAFR